MIKLKAGDTVKIIAGKDKGRTAKIEKVLPKEGKAIVPGVNMYKKHVKGVGDVKGGVYDLPRPLPFGKVALICPKCKKQTRVGFKFAGSQKVRICKKCKKEIDTK
ncbi:MAG: 50S ribosomal protein L24 [Candidatus Woesebacteria bacterium GW2011_GWB1_45_5]|uniref:Large ribosomal subunit protein uL24 n=1 Tax=Candidatus Woesebacteria bacterium GW2011_GWB1_45_5 TaxID=1618581 RepID=A0A0G1QKY1_9BACT|nr:MAG: 50S ribosomal protein L24 [Candidatus Woesebacteria bacterium GW2011_GWB1_45_5]